MQTVYLILQIIGGAAGAIYFLTALRLCKIKAGRIAGSCVIAVVCLALSVLIVTALSGIIYTLPQTNRALSIYSEYYITLIFFSALYVVLAGVFGLLKSTSGAAAESLIIFSFIARIGCCVTGCCGGKDFGGFTFPLQYLELGFAALIFITMRAARIKYKLGFYLFSYSIFRFLVEFLRENDNIALHGGINVRQYLAIAVVFVIFVIAMCHLGRYFLKRRRNA